MTGLYVLIIFFLGAGLGIMVYAYIEEKESHKAEISNYHFVIDKLDTDNKSLTRQLKEAEANYSALEEGRTEIEEAYQQQILDYIDAVETRDKRVAYLQGILADRDQIHVEGV